MFERLRRGWLESRNPILTPRSPIFSMTRTLVLLLACACGAMVPARADAQRSGASLEATLGFSAGGGGGFSQRNGIALDLLLAKPVGRAPAGPLVAAFTAGVRGPFAGNPSCLVTRDGTCLPDFPRFVSAGVLVGVQHGSATGANARLLAGPAVFAALEGGSAPALQGRLDAATSTDFRIALVASLQGAVVASYQGEWLTTRSISVGVRIQ